jgi:hypothetical protein
MASRRIDSPAHDFGRRRFLMAALGSGVALTNASLLSAAEFWNTRDPSMWTEDEIRILTSKSPWAREAVPGIKRADDPTESVGAGGGRSGMRIQTVRIYVRWESAQPILDALRTTLEPDLAGHYVVSVTNLPMPTVHRMGRGANAEPDETMERIQNGTTLSARGKEPIPPEIVRRNHIGSIVFAFPKDTLRLTSNDREILFQLETDLLTLKTKFDGKDMVYHGKLAV